MVLVGARAVAAAVLLVALAVPVQGSLLESATGGVVAYQFDGDSHHDAPDTCEEAGPAWSVKAGTRTDGILVPGEDPSDVFVVDVPADAVGDRFTFSVGEAVGTPDVALTTFLPGCLTDVLDPGVQPTPHPSPPEPAADEQQVTATRGDDPYRCDETLRRFVITRLEGVPAPASIHVAWTNGQERTIPLAWESHEFSMYTTDADLGITLKGAWANVPAEWAGQFMLVQGPCDAVDGGAVYGDAATSSGSRLAFTPVQPGPYVVQVVYSGKPPATSMTLTCHVCTPEVERVVDAVSYRLSALKETTAE